MYPIKIDKESRVPLYYQIYTEIKNLIVGGTLKQGDFLCSESELQRDLGVSRATIRKAYKELSEKGYILKQQGKSCRVQDPRGSIELNKITSFSDDMMQKGKEIRSIILDIKAISAEIDVAKALNVEVGTVIYCLKRLRLIDNEIIGYHEAYIPFDIGEKIGITKFGHSTSLYKEFSNVEINLVSAEETIEAMIANEFISRQLSLNTIRAIFYKERVTYSKNNYPVEFVKMYYKADKYKFKVKLNQNM
ncbi:GntR family transcriptional regulator [Abyssisolibacter fermentans]|uniref:GntR family transcriptional regulator n=1 Tax=Abyssisolibacter fermentans TaxID=1766203 RepID=UPI00082B5973|nr:GntR family transcriptional regulator [Abyssisolibacter fermentans]